MPGTVLAMKLAAGSTTFSSVPMKAIRRSHIETWVKAMNAAGLAPGTVTTAIRNSKRPKRPWVALPGAKKRLIVPGPVAACAAWLPATTNSLSSTVAGPFYEPSQSGQRIC